MAASAEAASAAAAGRFAAEGFRGGFGGAIPAEASAASSCNSPVAPTGLPGPSRACCCDRSNDFRVTCRTHPSPRPLQGTSLRQVNCRNSRRPKQAGIPVDQNRPGHHCDLNPQGDPSIMTFIRQNFPAETLLPLIFCKNPQGKPSRSAARQALPESHACRAAPAPESWQHGWNDAKLQQHM